MSSLTGDPTRDPRLAQPLLAPEAASARAQPRALLVAPRLSLGACIRAFVWRSTVSCDLAPEQRLNHMPATPLCAITWFIAGTGQWEDGTPAGRISFCGPRTRPATSFNPVEVEVLTMLVTPDALHALLGFDAAAHVDRTCLDVATVFDPAWLDMLRGVLEQPDLPARIRLIEDFIEVRWHAMRADGWHSAQTYRNWAEGLAARATMSGVGRSVRQTHRRVRAWAGLPLGKLEALARAERALIEAQSANALQRLKWAEVAADAGYADQPHLCRETRRITGLSPQQLLDRIDDDECFWIYRLWR